MGAFLDLLLLAVIMFVLTFLVGLIPLKCVVKPGHMSHIATVGAGLLLGTAFIVIIPEGIELLMEGIEEEIEAEELNEAVHHVELFDGALLGLSIVSGIIFMLFVERIGPAHSHGHGHQRSPHTEQPIPIGSRAHHLTEVEELRPRLGRDLVISDENKNMGSAVTASSSPARSSKSKQSGTLTLGLVIHAAIDGIALGTVTAGGKNPTLSLVVFGALLGHKAPASFSLSAILMSQGLKARQVIRNLLFFCGAAPIGALVTFLILDAGLSSISDNAGTALGYCMLFSGGTFIGVIFEHILPELKGADGKFTWAQLVIFTVGALIPLSIPGDDHH